MNTASCFLSNCRGTQQMPSASGRVGSQVQDMARTLVVGGLCVSTNSLQYKGAAATPFRNQWHHARVASSSSRLALRASVLRRAVSLATRPMLRCWPSSVTVGREALQHHRSSQSVAGLCMSSSKLCPKSLQCSTLSCGANLPHAKTLRPNHSLNRTHCGMRPKARHFILGL